VLSRFVDHPCLNRAKVYALMVGAWGFEFPGRYLRMKAPKRLRIMPGSA
jgi:hypothetical protein